MTYTDAQRQEWERACEKAGTFDKDNSPHITTHYYPDIGDATATLAMLEWLLYHKAWTFWKHTHAEYRIAAQSGFEAVNGFTIPLAVSAAVNASKP